MKILVAFILLLRRLNIENLWIATPLSEARNDESRNSHFRYFIAVLIITFINLPLNADDFSNLEKVISIAEKRISSGILLINNINEKNFIEEANKQIEFAMHSLNLNNLLEEDYINLSLYCLARKKQYYSIAISILKSAYEVENYPKLKRWIKKRISILEQYNFYESDFDIKKELQNLKQSLK